MVLFRTSIRTDMLAVINDVRDDEYFRVTVEAEILQHMVFQFTEPATEGDLRFRRHVLVANKQQAVIRQAAPQVREVRLRQGSI